MAYDDYAVAARWYDPAYERLQEGVGDAAFYLALARETGGPVLELGCGTGRVLLPMPGPASRPPASISRPPCSTCCAGKIRPRWFASSLHR